MAKDCKQKKSSRARFTYDYPRPMLTVDAVIVAQMDRALKVLLIQRRYPPYQGCWALPGGFVDQNEQALAAAHRELSEETGLKRVKLKCIGFFDTPGRDPRGWTVSVVHLGFVNPAQVRQLRAADDAEKITFRPLATQVKLAFDHGRILCHADRWIQNHPVPSRSSNKKQP